MIKIITENDNTALGVKFKKGPDSFLNRFRISDNKYGLVTAYKLNNLLSRESILKDLGEYREDRHLISKIPIAKFMRVLSFYGFEEYINKSTYRMDSRYEFFPDENDNKSPTIGFIAYHDKNAELPKEIYDGDSIREILISNYKKTKNTRIKITLSNYMPGGKEKVFDFYGDIYSVTLTETEGIHEIVFIGKEDKSKIVKSFSILIPGDFCGYQSTWYNDILDEDDIRGNAIEGRIQLGHTKVIGFIDEVDKVENELLEFVEGDEFIREHYKAFLDAEDTNEKTLEYVKNNIFNNNTVSISIEKNKEGDSYMTNIKDRFSSLMPQRLTGGVAFTMFGKIAVRNAEGNYVTYNPETKTIEDSMDLVFGEDKIKDFAFLMPVASNTIKEGDIVLSGNDFHYVDSVDKEKGATYVNLTGAVKNEVVPVKNLLTNSSMVKKLFTLFDGASFGGEGGGGVNPMMFLLMGKDGKNTDDMFKLMLMSQMMGGDGKGTGGINPLMFALMWFSTRK